MNLLEMIPITTQPLLICVRAEHIGACQLMIPVLTDIQVDYENQLKFILVEHYEDQNFMQAFHIIRYPSWLMFYRGTLWDKVEGLINRKKLYERIDLFICNSQS